ncbi:cytochrome P450 [Rhodoblastus sp.]|jgi:hypothetical protein|uniref:cytochrome P450 n=1 Tax=Rhodoblastus sp. TaxID=1962975 RepID=UPI0025DFFB5E|nr:cytochrome P450 [Rhodoblastus sp.]
MSQDHPQDWDPRATPVLDDQIGAYDQMRRQCPVAFSNYLQWSLFRHDDVQRVLRDHETFSNAASAHLSIPNGMDPPEHTPFRKIIEPYFLPSAMSHFEPVCRGIAVNLVARLPVRGEVELMRDFAQDFALQIQCAFMGWPATLHEPLRDWTRRNREATLAADREAMAAVALQFDGCIRELLHVRRAAGATAPDDTTTQLLREQVNGRPIADEEIVSIVRNWTVGELATISACVGLIVGYLAARPSLQSHLRSERKLLPAAIDEILRIDAPLISNRRRTTRAVEIGGQKIEAGERLTLIWASANRDEAKFGDPDEFRLDRNPDDNLLYGAGIHVCPGAPLARLELRIVMEELLARTQSFSLLKDKPPSRAAYPAGGFATLPLWVEAEPPATSTSLQA